MLIAIKRCAKSRFATTLMPALLFTSIIHILCGNDARANEQANELVVVADEKHSALRKAFGVLLQGIVSALTGRSSEARQTISVGISALQATGSTLWKLMLPLVNTLMLGGASAKR